MSTGRTIALIKALGGGGGGGGGGSEEKQFQKVYETTLQDDSEDLLITSDDIGGSYIDMVVYVDSNSSSPFANDTTIVIEMSVDEDGEYLVCGEEDTIPSSSSWNFCAAAQSVGGLAVTGKAMVDVNKHTLEKMFYPVVTQYPSEDLPGISYVFIGVREGIPAGTKITIYARRKVA